MSMGIIVLVALVIILVALYYFVDREIYFYEGMRLGPHIQRWLYDRWAARYDLGKQASQAQDADMLARPILQRLDGKQDPLILDLATGTGRLPLGLLREPGFSGQFIAMDISKGMLELASFKLASFQKNLDFIQYLTLPLPFPDETFDVVCCLEALEVMPEMDSPLRELYRVLRSGGLLVTSRGTEASGRKAKIRSAKEFSVLLQTSGFTQVEILSWWKYFDRVFARKPGHLIPTESHILQDFLCCGGCGKVNLQKEPNRFVCKSCGAAFPLTEDRILVFDVAEKSLQN